MSEWNPFADPPGSPYLRNVAGLTDHRKIARSEFGLIRRNMPVAVAMLESEPCIDLSSWREVHRILFGELYPWAGSLREVTAARGSVAEFVAPRMIEREAAKVFALAAPADDVEGFVDAMGEVYGGMARCHPFLEGNGRSMNAVFSELCRRAGFGIAWDTLRRDEWLEALTSAVGFGHCDALHALFCRNMLVPPDDAHGRSRRLSHHKSGPHHP